MCIYLYLKIKITGAGDYANAGQVDKRNKEVILKNYAPFTEWIYKINNTQVDNAKDLDVVMPTYNNLIAYSDNYSETLESLWQYYRGEPALDKNSSIV